MFIIQLFWLVISGLVISGHNDLGNALCVYKNNKVSYPFLLLWAQSLKLKVKLIFVERTTEQTVSDTESRENMEYNRKVNWPGFTHKSCQIYVTMI